VDKPIDESLRLAKERTELAKERNKMANDRTFLSWIRTGLAFVGGGIAIIRFLSFVHFTNALISKITGQILIVGGIAVFIFALINYKNSCIKLKLENADTGSIWMARAMVCMLAILSALLLFITA